MVGSTHHKLFWKNTAFSFSCILRHHIIFCIFLAFSFLGILCTTPPPSSFLEKWKRLFVGGFENFEKWIFLENIFLGLEVYGVWSGIIFISGFCCRRNYCIQKFF